MSRDKRSCLPTRCLEKKPTSKSIRFAGRYISLMEIERTTGMDHSYLSYIIQGKRTPTVPYAQSIARALGMLTEDGDPNITALFAAIEDRKAELDADYRRRLA